MNPEDRIFVAVQNSNDQGIGATPMVGVVQMIAQGWLEKRTNGIWMTDAGTMEFKRRTYRPWRDEYGGMSWEMRELNMAIGRYRKDGAEYWHSGSPVFTQLVETVKERYSLEDLRAGTCDVFEPLQSAACACSGAHGKDYLCGCAMAGAIARHLLAILNEIDQQAAVNFMRRRIIQALR